MTAPLPAALADLAAIIDRCGGRDMDAVTFAACRGLASRLAAMAAEITAMAQHAIDHRGLDEDDLSAVAADILRETWPVHTLEVLGLELRSDWRKDLGRGR